MRWKFLLVLIVLVFSIVFISAEFVLDPILSNIDSDYYSGDKIRGNLQLSFEGQLKSSEIVVKFEEIFGVRKNLFDFIGEQPSVEVTCSPISCEHSYAVVGEEFESKDIDIVSTDSEVVVGVVLEGQKMKIDDIQFDVLSNANADCSNQLLLDVADDEVVEWANDKLLGTGVDCEQIKTECDSQTFPKQYKISQVPYCNIIMLKPGPGFRIEAGIQKVTGDFERGLLKAWIYDETELVKSCELTDPSSSGKSSCIITYSNKQEATHYICIGFADTISEEDIATYDYTIGANIDSKCGFRGDPTQTITPAAEYDIKIHGQKYGGVGSFTVDNSFFNKQTADSLIDYLNDYLKSQYPYPNDLEGQEGGNCGDDGCVIPFKFSGKGQTLSLSNLNVLYTDAGGQTSITKFHNLEKTGAKITSESQQYDLSYLNIKAPVQEGDYLMKISLENELVIEKTISVSTRQGLFARQLYPSIAAVENPTLFTLVLDPDLDESLFTFEWDFGDDTGTLTSTKNQITHNYRELGNYNVKVNIYQQAVKVDESIFEVKAESPKEAIASTIELYEGRLARVKSQIESFPAEYKDEYVVIIEDSLGSTISEIESGLVGIKETYSQLATPVEGVVAEDELASDAYIPLMKDLILLSVPVSIQPIKTVNAKFAQEANDVDLVAVGDLFNDFANESIVSPEEEVAKWFMSKLDVSAVHKIIVIYYDDGIEEIISESSFTISPKSTLDYSGYFVIGIDADDLIFKQEYSIDSESGITGLTIDLSSEQTIDFAVKEGVDFFELGIFLAPGMFVLEEGGTYKDGGKSIWIIIFSFVILIIVALIIYFYLHNWYKKNYEKSLFKSKRDLYNLIYFIRNSKAKGLGDKQIDKKLKMAKWKDEQVDYAMALLKGKKPGMPEFPIKIKSKKGKGKGGKEQQKKKVVY